MQKVRQKSERKKKHPQRTDLRVFPTGVGHLYREDRPTYNLMGRVSLIFVRS